MDIFAKTALAEGSYVAYTAGSCKGNPGPGGAAYLIHTPDGQTREGSRQSLDTKNNIAELQAIIDAIAATPENTKVLVCSNSGYVGSNFKLNLPTWRKNGWCKTDGKDVANREYWEKLVELAETRTVTFHKVKAHTGDCSNEHVRGLAKTACERAVERAFKAAWGDN